MDKYIPLSVPNLCGNELKYVEETIKTQWISTAGEYVNRFENDVAKYVNAKGAVSCQNGTSGLHISLILSDVTNEDEVIVPTLTFIAAVNPVKYVGAEPIFMDCDDSLCLDPEKLSEFCEDECEFKDYKLINKITGKHIKALIVVHVFGNIANMEYIIEIARKYNLKVIEDATEALGSRYVRGEYEGKFAGTIGDIGVYSFNGNKIITTGGGGMIVSNNEDLLERAKHLTTQAKKDELYYVHDEIGYNYRMTNLQAALGVAQLEQIERFIETKQRNLDVYIKEIAKLEGLSIKEFNANIRSNCWFYTLICEKKHLLSRDEVLTRLSKNNIQARPIWGLISEQKPYKNNQSYKIEKAKKYLDKVVNIPCSSNLKLEEIFRVVECLKNC